MDSPSTTTSTDLQPGAAGGRSLKALWATIGALAVAVVAMGGVLLHRSGSDVAPPAPVAALEAPARAPVQAPDDFKPPDAVPAPAPVQAPLPAPGPAQVAQAEVPAPAMAPPVMAPPVMAPPVMAPPAVVPRPAPVCRDCGRVESVRTVHREQPTSGVGAVAGGVLGGVLGHQIGNGRGRSLATVIGAVGGGLAGNEVEKRTHTVTVYEVSVRMRDGSLRHVETATAPPIGKAVTLQGNVLRPANGQP